MLRHVQGELMNYWIAVASRNHVQIGIVEGIMQLCHGKEAPLKRIKPGDGIIYYSPTVVYGGKEKCQSFTAIGRVTGDQAYLHQLNSDFCAFRKDVDYVKAIDIPIAPLIPELSFIKDKKHWGALISLWSR